MAGSVSIGVRERVLEFLAKYGEKGYYVLKAAVEASLQGGSQRRGVRLGDFSYREVVAKLRSYGLEYNPANLLSKLERDYAVIETSYRSSGQHWWRFIDLDAVIEALDEYERGSTPAIGAGEAEESTQAPLSVGGGYGEPDASLSGDEGLVDDPMVEVVRAQIAAIAPAELLKTLRMLAAKPRLNSYDRRLFSKIAFEDLEMVARVLEKARAYPEVFAEEIRLLENILRLASIVARKLMVGGRGVQVKRAAASIPVRGDDVMA